MQQKDSPEPRPVIEPSQHDPSGSGLLFEDPSWLQQTPVANHPFTALDIRDSTGGLIGQMLGIFPSHPQAQPGQYWANRAGQDGYRWSGMPFPPQFRMTPVVAHGAHGLQNAQVAWYLQSSFQGYPNPQWEPTEAAWSIAIEGSPVGWLFRKTDGSRLRWVVLTSKLNGAKFPKKPLRMQAVTTVTFAAGQNYSLATDLLA